MKGAILTISHSVSFIAKDSVVTAAFKAKTPESRKWNVWFYQVHWENGAVFFSIRGRFLLQNPHWHCEIQLTYTCGLEQASVCAWSQLPICFLQSRPEKFDCSKSANVTCRFVLLGFSSTAGCKFTYLTVGLRFALKSLSEGEQHSASGFKTKPLIVWGTGTTVLHRLSGFIYIPVNVFIWLRQRDTFPAELVLPWFEPSIKPWKQ